MKINVSNIDIEWDPDKGICRFEKLPVAMMWVDTTLAGLMSGMQFMVGPKRFNLALQSEGRNSVEADWQVFMEFPNFEDGFKAIANIAAVAGWGRWKLISMDENRKECHFQVWDSWEGLYQKALGVCWGSGMVAGKMAGYCSKYFKTNCWAIQTKFIAKGDEYDEFYVEPSDRTIEEEISKLLTTDEATKADMAVALTKLTNEINERKKIEKQLRQSEKRFKGAYNRAEFYKDLFAHDINNLLQSILSSSQLIEVLSKKDELVSPIKKALNIIKEQVDRGSKLVYNVRKLSLLEDYNMIIEKIEIIDILKKSIELLKNSFQEREIYISIDSCNDQIFIRGNELIQDVFENILINSVKHNNNPTIKINVKISKVKTDDICNYKLEFIDNGIGIEDSRKNFVFQRAYKDAKSASGMGLGLSLVKKIVDLYKGKIWVEDRIKNDYSKGSNFIILLPEVNYDGDNTNR